MSKAIWSDSDEKLFHQALDACDVLVENANALEAAIRNVLSLEGTLSPETVQLRMKNFLKDCNKLAPTLLNAQLEFAGAAQASFLRFIELMRAVDAPRVAAQQNVNTIVDRLLAREDEEGTLERMRATAGLHAAKVLIDSVEMAILGQIQLRCQVFSEIIKNTRSTLPSFIRSLQTHYRRKTIAMLTTISSGVIAVLGIISWPDAWVAIPITVSFLSLIVYVFDRFQIREFRGLKLSGQTTIALSNSVEETNRCVTEIYLLRRILEAARGGMPQGVLDALTDLAHTDSPDPEQLMAALALLSDFVDSWKELDLPSAT